MKKLGILILFLISTLPSFSTNYYISSAGSDINSGTSQNAPWQTISKLNTSWASINPGDSILFRRGDTFTGPILPGKSGTVSSKIVIGSYGSGNYPIITGLTSLTSWTNSTSGVWYSTVSQANKKLFIVTVSNRLQKIGRFPNSTGPNTGYLTYQSFNSSTPSITDTNLPKVTAINWTNSDVVIRKQRWILDICRVTRISSNVISYTNPAGTENTYFGKNGYGYFFQNDIRTLDQFGEYYLDTATKRLSIYFPANNPTSYSIKASIVDTLVNCGGVNGRTARSYLTFQNLRLEGANNFAVFSWNCAGITVQNCEFYNNYNGIFIWNSSDAIVQNNSIYYTLNNACKVQAAVTGNATISGNTIRWVGLYEGMGESGDEEYNAIQSYVQDAVAGSTVIESNRIDSVGYIGINYSRSNVKVRYNYITNCLMTKDDGGLIYTYNDTNRVNRLVEYNIADGAIGAPNGGGVDGDFTNESARCFYVDGQASDITIRNNIAANSAGAGYYYNSPADVRTSNNIAYNVSVGISLQRFAVLQQLRRDTITNNLFFPRRSNIFYWNAALNTPTPVSIFNDLKNIGYIDSNYYRSDIPSPFDYYYHLISGGTFVNPTPVGLLSWKSSMSTQESNSLSIQSIPTYSTVTLGTNRVSNPYYESNITGVNKSGNGTISWDNTSKITGVGTIKFTAPTPLDSTRYTDIFQSAGSITINQKYVVRFSTRGSADFGIARVFMKRTTSPFDALTDTQYVYFGSSIQNNEVLLTAKKSATGYIDIEVGQGMSTAYLDNILFYPSTVTIFNPFSLAILKYNATSSTTTVTLSGTWKDLRTGITYTNSITLQPYTGAILIQQPNAVGATTKMILNRSLSSVNTKIRLFPNPANHYINISIPSDTSIKCNLRTSDYLGRNHSNENIYICRGVNNFKIDLSNLHRGIYTVHMKMNGSNITKTFLKL